MLRTICNKPREDSTVYKTKLCIRKQPLSKTKEKTCHYYYSKEILGTELRYSYAHRNGSSCSDVYLQIYSKNAPIDDGSS